MRLSAARRVAEDLEAIKASAGAVAARACAADRVAQGREVSRGSGGCLAWMVRRARPVTKVRPAHRAQVANPDSPVLAVSLVLPALARRAASRRSLARLRTRTASRRDPLLSDDAGIRRRWRARLKAYLAAVARARRVLKRHQGDKPDPAKGIDVSMHQGTIDFKKVKAAGYRFVWIKATEGEGFTDPRFLDNVKAARAAGLTVGAYHFLRPRPGRNGAAEADDFAKQLKTAGLGKGDLLPIADVEYTELSPSATVAYTRDFLDAVQTRTGVMPLLYTYPGFLANWQGVGPTRLWIADYGPNNGQMGGRKPRLPIPFKTWVAWQYTSQGRVPGVIGNCDVNDCPDLRKVIA